MKSVCRLFLLCGSLFISGCHHSIESSAKSPGELEFETFGIGGAKNGVDSDPVLCDEIRALFKYLAANPGKEYPRELPMHFTYSLTMKSRSDSKLQTVTLYSFWIYEMNGKRFETNEKQREVLDRLFVKLYKNQAPGEMSELDDRIREMSRELWPKRLSK